MFLTKRKGGYKKIIYQCNLFICTHFTSFNTRFYTTVEILCLFNNFPLKLDFNSENINQLLGVELRQRVL